MRLFVALDIDDAVRQRITRFMEGVRNFAPEARWVHVESLHLTLKFIGEQPDASLDRIKEALATVATGSFEVQLGGCGFFPTAKAARVFWIGTEAGPLLAKLASAIDETMPALGIPKETRPFSPHLTLARASGGSAAPGWRKSDGPKSIFVPLQNKLAALTAPEFGTMTAREFFLYRSQLSPKGSKYTKLARFVLGLGS
jgi:2'-5' RNA ligase